MFEVPTIDPTDAFGHCWVAAARHLEKSAAAVQAKLVWMRARLEPPMLEHLSFRLGNSLFFVRIEDERGELEVPGTRQGVYNIAMGCEGFACVMPMRRNGPWWETVAPGWGLVHLLGGKPLDPPSEVTDVPVVMTDWELHDFGVQVVRDWLAKDGARIMSSQGNPDVDPSLWFVRDRGPEWVVVRTARYPDREAPRPDNLDEIAAGCARLSRFGHFASVAVVSTSQAFRDAHEPTVPLVRGGPMHVRFTGLEPFVQQRV